MHIIRACGILLREDRGGSHVSRSEVVALIHSLRGALNVSYLVSNMSRMHFSAEKWTRFTHQYITSHGCHPVSFTFSLDCPLALFLGLLKKQASATKVGSESRSNASYSG